MLGARSISSRLTVWFSTVYFAGLALFGAAMWFNLQHTLTSARSRTLERRADRLSDLLGSVDWRDAQQRDRKFQAFAEATGGGLMEVFRADGPRALHSPSQAAMKFPWPTGTAGARDAFDQVNYAGQPFRVLARAWMSPDGPVILRVAAPLEGNLNVLYTFRDGMLWTVPAFLLLSALGGYWLSRRALRPVDEITEATRSISVNNLSERLPVPATRDELQRLSETCNAMLGRLESAVAEIKRFTADASHELRTPIALMQTVAELALRNPQVDRESRRAFSEIVDEAARTGQLLEEMLTLARADDGSARLSFEPVDLAEVIRVVSPKARLLAESHGHAFTVSIADEDPAVVLGDYSTLQRLLWILVDNAVKYTAEPGSIGILMEASGGRVTIAVKDTGMGISAADLPHIFDRFYRADRSRAGVEGSGLGLAIARWIVEIHQGEMSVESREQQGTVFRIAFPAHSALTERLVEMGASV